MTQGEEGLSLISSANLEHWAEECLLRLRRHASEHPGSATAIRFGRSLRLIGDITLGDTGEAAFRLDNGIFILNPEPLVQVFLRIRGEMFPDNGQLFGLSSELFLKYCQFVLAVYLFHEMRHIDQHIDDFEDIQTLKSIGLPSLVAEFDLLADRDAIVAFAEIYQGGEIGGGYLEAFKVGLSFSTSYFFHNFEFSPKLKPHKSLRAVGIVVMLARLLVAEDYPNIEPKTSLDSALTFYGIEGLGDDSSLQGFAIISEQPSRSIYQIGDGAWASALYGMLEAIEKHNFDLAIAIAMRVVRDKEFGDVEVPDNR